MAEPEASFFETAGDPCHAVVLSAPHAGSDYPVEVTRNSALATAELRVLEDGPTDLLGRRAASDGAALLAARYARAYADLNRGPNEIDPAILGGEPFPVALEASLKVRAGLGVVPSRIGARPIWRRPLGRASLEARLERAWHPYHARLERLLAERSRRLGRAILIDLHSMPSEAAWSAQGQAVDVAVGDRWGRSADPQLVAHAAEVLGNAGLVTSRNRPYAGGFITQHYGRPALGWHAIQLEVRRDLFVDPTTLEPHGGMLRLARVVQDLVRALDHEARRLPASRRPTTPHDAPAASEEEALRAAD